MNNTEKIEIASSEDIKDIAKIVSKTLDYSERRLYSMYMHDIELFQFAKWVVIKKGDEVCGSVFIYTNDLDINTIHMHSFVIVCEIKPSTLVSFYKVILKTMALDDRPNPQLVYNEAVFSKGFITAIRKKRYIIYKRFLESAGYKVCVEKRLHFWPFPILVMFILKIKKV